MSLKIGVVYLNEHLLKKNRKRFKELNITKWQEAGYAGEGIKVAILGVGEDAHHNGEWLLQSVAKDAEIIELDCMHGSWNIALQYCIDNDIDIICSSLVKGSWSDELEELSKQLYENKCIMLDSSDNNGGNIQAYPALSTYWFPIGAINDDKEREGYSNFGEKLAFVMYTNFANKNYKGNYIGISHTSGTPQVPSGMVSILKQFYGRKNFGGEEFKEYLQIYCEDVQEKGKDIYTGNGLLKLPDEILQKEVVEVNKPCKIILHHSLTKDGKVVDFNAIKKYHVETNGWRDIGYHYVIENVGGQYKILKGRDEKAIGAHTKGENGNSIGICLVGNYDIGIPPKQQLEKLVELIKDIRNRHGKLPVYGHCDFPDPNTGYRKSCPGKKFPWKELNNIMADNKKLSEVSDWAKDSWEKAVRKGINDGEGPKNPVTEEQMMVFLDRLGLLD